MRKPISGLLVFVIISLTPFILPAAADMTAADKIRFYRMREEALAKSLANWKTSTSQDAAANVARVTKEQADISAKINALVSTLPKRPPPKCGAECAGDPVCELKCTNSPR